MDIDSCDQLAEVLRDAIAEIRVLRDAIDEFKTDIQHALLHNPITWQNGEAPHARGEAKQDIIRTPERPSPTACPSPDSDASGWKIERGRIEHVTCSECEAHESSLGTAQLDGWSRLQKDRSGTVWTYVGRCPSCQNPAIQKDAPPPLPAPSGADKEPTRTRF